MRFSTFTVLALFSAVATAAILPRDKPHYPECAKSCQIDSPTGDCKPHDLDCLCHERAWLEGTLHCYQRRCNDHDKDKALEVRHKDCIEKHSNGHKREAAPALAARDKPNYPKCAKSCQVDSPTGDCKPHDLDCLCHERAWLEGTLHCYQDRCDRHDKDKALEVRHKDCIEKHSNGHKRSLEARDKPNYPECAKSCQVDSPTGHCKPHDLDCLCHEPAWLDGTLHCYQDRCSTHDKDKALEVRHKDCIEKHSGN